MASMPLRQTCDRCRDLKVRCKRESLSSSDRCVRCLKADAPCIYNPRRRSGRPTTDSIPRRKSGHARPRSEESIDFAIDGPLQKWRSGTQLCPDMTLGTSLSELNGDFSWLNAAMDDISEAADQFIEPRETPDSSTLDPDNGLDLFSSELAPHPPPVQEERVKVTTDTIETDIRELTELNLKAYRVTTRAGIASTNELIAMTRAILRILGRVAATARRQQDRVPLFHDDAPKTTISLVLQAISVCEQILDAFTHVCSALYTELRPQTRSANSSNNNNNNSSNSNKDHCSLSDARAVMTVELINHLFEKLGRGQKEILATAFPIDEVSSPDLDSLTFEDPTTGLSIHAQSPSASLTGIIPVILQRSQGKHPQLQAHIWAIRDLTRKNNGI